MLCIPKRNGTLRTVIDCRKHNDNTVKDVTPLPDQDQIRMDVAKAAIKSKIDLSNAYEQQRVEPDDVWKTASNFPKAHDNDIPRLYWKICTRIRLVFNQLQKYELYLQAEKVELYAEVVDCLGHKIDHRGIQMKFNGFLASCNTSLPSFQT